ncbi:hypothetical protein N431DRAFT_446567 [Stipitochalara longipes BDJ]|nr:hypothetical protein N431DRAFT_446567 [Stipitochalara longipes BDJ]
MEKSPTLRRQTETSPLLHVAEHAMISTPARQLKPPLFFSLPFVICGDVLAAGYLERPRGSCCSAGSLILLSARTNTMQNLASFSASRLPGRCRLLLLCRKRFLDATGKTQPPALRTLPTHTTSNSFVEIAFRVGGRQIKPQVKVATGVTASR